MSAGYDLVLVSSGALWVDTFTAALETAVNDILDAGPYGPVEITLANGQTITGTLQPTADDPNTAHMISVDGVLHMIDDVIGFRA